MLHSIRSYNQHARAPSRLSAFGVAFILVATVAAGASAQTQVASDDAKRTEARQLGAGAIDDYEAGRFVEADQKLDRAYELFAAPTVALWSARARVQLGRWVEAAERYKTTISLSVAVGDNQTQAEAKREAGEELTALSARIPSLVLSLQNASASEVRLLLDNVELSASQIGVPYPINPGSHKLVATRGSERVELALQLAERQRKSLVLKFAAHELQVVPPVADPTAGVQPSAASAGRSSTLKALGVAGLVVGGVGLAASLASALVASDKLEPCGLKNGSHTCHTQSQLDTYNTAKTVATVTFWSGSALIIAGASALLANTRPQQAPERSVGWAIGPTSVSVHGAF